MRKHEDKDEEKLHEHLNKIIKLYMKRLDLNIKIKSLYTEGLLLEESTKTQFESHCKQEKQIKRNQTQIHEVYKSFTFIEKEQIFAIKRTFTKIFELENGLPINGLQSVSNSRIQFSMSKKMQYLINKYFGFGKNFLNFGSLLEEYFPMIEAEFNFYKQKIKKELNADQHPRRIQRASYKSLSSTKSFKITKIFEKMRKEKKQTDDFIKKKGESSDKIWINLSRTVELDRNKFQQLHVFAKVEDQYNKIYASLIEKNRMNKKQINAFIRKKQKTERSQLKVQLHVKEFRQSFTEATQNFTNRSKLQKTFEIVDEQDRDSLKNTLPKQNKKKIFPSIGKQKNRLTVGGSSLSNVDLTFARIQKEVRQKMLNGNSPLHQIPDYQPQSSQNRHQMEKKLEFEKGLKISLRQLENRPAYRKSLIKHVELNYFENMPINCDRQKTIKPLHGCRKWRSKNDSKILKNYFQKQDSLSKLITNLFS